MISRAALSVTARSCVVAVVLMCVSSITAGQTTSELLPDRPSSGASGGPALPAAPRPSKQSDEATGTETCALKHLGQCLKDMAQDQAGIWTSPLHLHTSDAAWLVPLAGMTGVAIHYDAQAQAD